MELEVQAREMQMADDGPAMLRSGLGLVQNLDIKELRSNNERSVFYSKHHAHVSRFKVGRFTIWVVEGGSKWGRKYLLELSKEVSTEDSFRAVISVVPGLSSSSVSHIYFLDIS